MAINLKGRSLLTLKDYTPEEISFLLELSHKVKRERREGSITQRFKSKTLALLVDSSRRV